MPKAAITTSGDATSGTATVTPATTSYYVLRAKGEGGRDTAFVQVAVGEALKDVVLIAVPPEVTAGRSAELLWSAAKSTSATLKFDDTSEVLTGTSGSRTVTPSRSSFSSNGIMTRRVLFAA